MDRTSIASTVVWQIANFIFNLFSLMLKLILFSDKWEGSQTFHSDSSDLEFDFSDGEPMETIKVLNVQGMNLFVCPLLV